MTPNKCILLFYCIFISIEMIAQDTLVSKELTKADSLQTLPLNTFGYIYPYGVAEFQIPASLDDLQLNTSGLNYPNVLDGRDLMFIGAFNVSRGTVRVTAGDRPLLEGIEYTVNYQIGTVQILDPSYAANMVPIFILVEE